MKKIKLLSLLSLSLLFLFGSCEEDYVEHNHNQNTEKFKIENYTYKQASKLTTFKEPDNIIKSKLNLKISSLKNFNKIKSENVTARELNMGFAIDSSLIKQVSSSELTSYTMLVVLDSVDYSDGSFDNLVIQTNQNNKTEAFVIHYLPSTEIQYNSEHQSYTFEGTTSISKTYGITSITGGSSNLGNTGEYNNNDYTGEAGSLSNANEDSVTCITLILCNYQYTHIAGPGCQRTYSKTICYSNPYWNPWSSYGSSFNHENDSENNIGGTGGPGGVGSSNSNNNSTTTTVFPQELEEIYDETPCGKLKSLFTNPQLKIKNKILNDLRPNININPNGERGALLKKGAANYGYELLSATTDSEIKIKAGGLTFSAIHTHPTSTFPMFSWSDVYTLYTINNSISPTNSGILTSFMLVCKDQNGEFQTYAIVFNYEGVNTLDLIFNSPFWSGKTPEEIALEMDVILGEGYEKEEKNGTFDYAKAFLSQFSGSNVSLYKANSNLDSWSRLQINTATNNSVEIPCE